MIDEKKLAELPVYDRTFIDRFYPMKCLDAHNWDEVRDTLSALLKENAELKAVAREAQDMIDDGMIVTNQLRVALAVLHAPTEGKEKT